MCVSQYFCADNAHLVCVEAVRACVKFACVTAHLVSTEDVSARVFTLCAVNGACLQVKPNVCVRVSTLWLKVGLYRYVRVSNFVRKTHTWFELRRCVRVASFCAVNAHLV